MPVVKLGLDTNTAQDTVMPVTVMPTSVQVFGPMVVATMVPGYTVTGASLFCRSIGMSHVSVESAVMLADSVGLTVLMNRRYIWFGTCVETCAPASCTMLPAVTVTAFMRMFCPTPITWSVCCTPVTVT